MSTCSVLYIRVCGANKIFILWIHTPLMRLMPSKIDSGQFFSTPILTAMGIKKRFVLQKLPKCKLTHLLLEKFRHKKFRKVMENSRKLQTSLY